MQFPTHLTTTFRPPRGVAGAAKLAGFRLRAESAHTSRTMMLAEINRLLSEQPDDLDRASYRTAIVDENCLGKETVATRRSSAQRLGELYALDGEKAVFRILRHLWVVEPTARPLLALLCVLARDPLLAATAPYVIELQPGAEVSRDALRGALKAASEDRLNDAILEKVLRNVASTWTQSGHFEGRTFKRRRKVAAGPVATAYAVWLADTIGFSGFEPFATGWTRVLDLAPQQALDQTLEAKRLGLLDLQMSDKFIELDLARLDPRPKGRATVAGGR